KQRADDGEDEAVYDDLDAADAVGQTTHDDDENAGKQRRDRYGDIHERLLDLKVGSHVGRNVQRRLRKQPEGEDAQNNPEEQPVIATIGFSRSLYHEGPSQLYAGIRIKPEPGSLTPLKPFLLR